VKKVNCFFLTLNERFPLLSLTVFFIEKNSLKGYIIIIVENM